MVGSKAARVLSLLGPVALVLGAIEDDVTVTDDGFRVRDTRPDAARGTLRTFPGEGGLVKEDPTNFATVGVGVGRYVVDTRVTLSTIGPQSPAKFAARLRRLRRAQKYARDRARAEAGRKR